jgi:hypothetical protein
MTADLANSMPNVPLADLAYAPPEPRPSAKVWAAGVIIFSGLALIVLGGCFLIGVMVILGGATGFMGPAPKSNWPPSVYIFLGVLYALAFACFASAALLIVSGLRNLFKVLRG